MFLLTLISQPFWTFSTWHYTFPPDSRLYLCSSSCLGSSSPYPLVPPAPHHFTFMSNTPCLGASSLTLPSAPRAPLQHSSSATFIRLSVLMWFPAGLKASWKQGCVLLMVLSWHLTWVDSQSLLNGQLKDEWQGCAGKGLALQWSRDATQLQRIWRLT